MTKNKNELDSKTVDKIATWVGGAIIVMILIVVAILFAAAVKWLITVLF